MGEVMSYSMGEPEKCFVNPMACDTAELARREEVEPRYAPSADEARFAGARLWANLQDKRATAQLLYDSFAQTVAAGMRSIAMRVRQMLYRAEPFQIDIQVEVVPDRNRLIVTGQLIDVGHPDLLDAGIEVTLSDGRGNMVSTVTNQFGEFRGEVILCGDLEISFLRRDGKPVVILLRGTLDPTSRGKD